MEGVITSKTLVTHCRTIIREFGFKAWVKCVLIVLTGQRCTFLATVLNLKVRR